MPDPLLDEGEALHLTERISAPRETIFEFLVDPELIVRWIGTTADLHPEPGGTFWVNVSGTDIASGTYQVIDRPNHVVFTWGWEGSKEVPPGTSTVTITLTADGDDTVLDLYHAGLPGGIDDEHAHGWTHFLGRLVTVSTGGEVDPADIRPE